MKPKRYKICDMKMHWLRNKYIIKKIQVYWDKGDNNDADYFTKHFLPSIHIQQRPPNVHHSHIMTSSHQNSIHNTVIICQCVLNQVLIS